MGRARLFQVGLPFMAVIALVAFYVTRARWPSIEAAAGPTEVAEPYISLGEPPTEACSDLLGDYLQTIQAGKQGMDALLATRTSADSGVGDEEWQGLPRGKAFLKTLLTSPAGVDIRDLYRSSDLNPEDRHIHRQHREAIALALHPYVQAIKDAARKGEALFESDFQAAVAGGLGEVQTMPTFDAGNGNVSIQIGRITDASQVVRVQPMSGGTASCTLVSRKDMPAFSFHTRVYWMLVQELGCQAIAALRSVQVTPSGHGELMTKKVIDFTNRKMR